MELLISAVSALAMFTFLYLLVAAFAPAETPVAMRLRSLDGLGAATVDADEDLNRPFAQRVISPITGSLAAGMGRLTPRAVRRMVGDKLAAAGGFRQAAGRADRHRARPAREIHSGRAIFR